MKFGHEVNKKGNIFSNRQRAHPGVELSATLDAFLASDRNVARTARSLFVHYNTVKYRLERIERLLGSFTDSPQQCLKLELALHVGKLVWIM